MAAALLKSSGLMEVPKEGLVGIEIKRADSGARQPGLKSWLSYLLVM